MLAKNRWQLNHNLVLDGKLSSNGKFTSLLLANNSIELWNNATQQKVSTWLNDQLVAKTTLLDLSDSAEYILSANDNAIQLWRTETADPLGMVDFSTHLGDAKITQIRIWTAPTRFLIGTSSGDIIFADIANNSYRVNRHHTSSVTKLALSPDKTTLYSGGNDGLVTQWDLLNYRPVVTKTLPHRIVSLAVGNNNQVFISDALKDHILWNSAQNIVVGQIDHWKRFKWFRQALIVPNQSWLITSSPKTEMQLWQLKDMTLLTSWMVESQGLGSSVEDCKLIGTDTLRTLTTDGVLQDWDLSSFAL